MQSLPHRDLLLPIDWLYLKWYQSPQPVPSQPLMGQLRLDELGLGESKFMKENTHIYILITQGNNSFVELSRSKYHHFSAGTCVTMCHTIPSHVKSTVSCEIFGLFLLF